MTRRKRYKWQVGDLFAVPLSDGTRTLGQVVAHKPRSFAGAVVCGFTLSDSPEASPAPTHVERTAFLAIQHVTPELLDYGQWLVIGHASVPDLTSLVDPRTLEGSVWIGKDVHGAGLAVRFLEACLALRPWDEMHDPGYYEAWLLSPSMKPEGLIYTKGQPHSAQAVRQS